MDSLRQELDFCPQSGEWRKSHPPFWWQELGALQASTQAHWSPHGFFRGKPHSTRGILQELTFAGMSRYLRFELGVSQATSRKTRHDHGPVWDGPPPVQIGQWPGGIGVDTSVAMGVRARLRGELVPPPARTGRSVTPKTLQERSGGTVANRSQS